MKRHFISETTAKAAIFLLFALALLGFFMFWWTADSYSALQPIREQAEQLPEQLVLMGQVEELEGQLEAARQEAEQAREDSKDAKKQSEEAKKEADRLASAEVALTDTMKANYVGEFYATAYCCEEYPHICGGNGVTASGTKPTPGLTIAADWSVLPSGTWVYIEGVGIRRVEDTGSAIKGNRVDVAIDTHANALRWGASGNHHVWILTWG